MPARSAWRNSRRKARSRGVVIAVVLVALAGGLVIVDMRLGLAHSALALIAMTLAGCVTIALAVASVARREEDERRRWSRRRRRD